MLLHEVLLFRAEKGKSAEVSWKKSVSRKAASGEVGAVYERACCTVASADNFFPGVKSLSSPSRFPKKGDCTWTRRKGGGKNAPRGVGKFYVVGRVRGRAAVLSRERDQKLSLGEDTTLTIRARAKQLSFSPSHLLAISFSSMYLWNTCGKNAVGTWNDDDDTETLRFFDPAECLASLPLERKIFLCWHKTISQFRILQIFF